MSSVMVTLAELHRLAKGILVANQTSEPNAGQVAAALVAAEADGQKGHGASRIKSYAAQARSGKVDGHAVPSMEKVANSAVRVDAGCGFAYPAINVALNALAELAPKTGIAAAAIFDSHHSGVAGLHVEPLARQGLIGISFGNTPHAIAPWGGAQGLFGTNPIAFAAPSEPDPLVIDMSLSKAARGKVNVAAQSGEPIPEGWALDARGKPTTDPAAAMKGTMLPMGDAKGAQLVLMVEILAAALTGACFGFEASSFFTAEGEPPRVGQFLIAIDPQPFSQGVFAARLAELTAAIEAQPGTRIPGRRRFQARSVAARDGVELSVSLHEELKEMLRTPAL